MTAIHVPVDRCEPWCINHQDDAESPYCMSRIVTVAGVSAYYANRPTKLDGDEEPSRHHSLYVENGDAGLGIGDVRKFARAIDELALLCYRASAAAHLSQIG